MKGYMTIKSYTLSQSELPTARALVVAFAEIDPCLAQALGPTAPVQPAYVDRLSRGWTGAEWVRVVAHYQDSASVGYATLADLAEEHEWTDEVDPDFCRPE